ncbi:MAG: TerB family tellurite resistance protein [Flavobacteriaceae bacterium]
MRWLLAFIGYMVFRFPGALLGFFLGTLLEAGSRGQIRTSFQTTRVSAQEFELRLLALASMVIKADGKTTQSELDYVRAQFVQFFGKDRANEIFRIYNAEFKKSGVTAMEIGQFLVTRTRYEARLQMLDFLFRIAKADGKVSPVEVEKLSEIAGYMRISAADFNSIKAMFVAQTDSAYTILEVSKTSTDAEIKKAYRDLVKKHHPDRVRNLGPAAEKAAKEKFQRIQQAYEAIKNERGF